MEPYWRLPLAECWKDHFRYGGRAMDADWIIWHLARGANDIQVVVNQRRVWTVRYRQRVGAMPYSLLTRYNTDWLPWYIARRGSDAASTVPAATTTLRTQLLSLGEPESLVYAGQHWDSQTWHDSIADKLVAVGDIAALVAAGATWSPSRYQPSIASRIVELAATGAALHAYLIVAQATWPPDRWTVQLDSKLAEFKAVAVEDA